MDVLDLIPNGTEAQPDTVVDDDDVGNLLATDPDVGEDPLAEKPKVFPCEWDKCGQAFARRSDLTRHMRIHTNDRPWKCDECSKTFIQRSALTIHMRCHTGERPHKCDQCDKAFADTSSLARHRRIHTGARPYQCDECKHTFCRKTTLRKHLETKHKIYNAVLPMAANPRNRAKIAAAKAIQHNNTDIAGGLPIDTNGLEAEDVGDDHGIDGGADGVLEGVPPDDVRHLPSYIDPAIAIASAHHGSAGNQPVSAARFEHSVDDGHDPLGAFPGGGHTEGHGTDPDEDEHTRIFEQLGRDLQGRQSWT